MTGSTDPSPRPGGLVTGAADAAVTMGLPGVEKVYRGRRGVGFSALSGVDLAHRPSRDGGDHRPVGQRQEHHHQPDRRHRPVHRRHGDGQRPPAGPDDRGAARGPARPSARGPKSASTVR
jgi:hypothetical protein